jgi:hypothetical protein
MANALLAAGKTMEFITSPNEVHRRSTGTERPFTADARRVPAPI